MFCEQVMSNKPTLDEILYPIYNYGWPGTGMAGSQRQMTQEEAKQQLTQLIQEAELAAVRADRLANAKFWQNNINKMFDKEIATYETL